MQSTTAWLRHHRVTLFAPIHNLHLSHAKGAQYGRVAKGKSSNRHRVAVGCLTTLLVASRPAWSQSAPPTAPPSGTPGAAAVAPPTGTPAADDEPSPATREAGDASATTVDVTTVDGAVFHGELVEKLPGQYVTLRLATGEFRKIAWAAIARIQQHAPRAGASTGSAGGVKTLVRFDASNPDAALEKYVGSWQEVCLAPCEGEISEDGAYRIGGKGIRVSEPFTLPHGARRVVVHASVGTDGRSALGAILAIGGGVGAYIGALAWLFSLGTVGDQGGRDGSSSGRTTGEVFLVGGLAVGITGFVILMNNGTDVSVNPGRGSASARPVNLFGPFMLGPRGVVF